ncbi:hypothetical protein [Proteiniphilum acetatigenes]|uniref:hypothetical protein n=1 Tax=Proteiniphilum acetatigenes TaxID=294710 RepID=UPI0003A574BF|nr:hypothetical protein SAMN05216357_102390 [Porphyromonadaceae bacterium KH3CP3RA]
MVVVTIFEEDFIHFEHSPEFPEGNAALMKFLSDSMRYPVIAMNNGIQGLGDSQFYRKGDSKRLMKSNIFVKRGQSEFIYFAERRKCLM